MTGIFGTQSYQTPYAASPYYDAGAQVAQTGGQLVQTVAQPVVGFAGGLLHGRGILLGLGIIAVVLINARDKSA